MKETKIKHFFEYLDYENIVSEDCSFELPSKNDKGIFITNLSKPFAFYLPKSELCDMFQDVYGNNVINYIINLDCHSEIVQFLENFDTLCINNASDNSKKWCGKELNSEKLIKYYNTLYELSEDEKTLYLPIVIGTEDIEEIIRYNENSDLILSVKITGIEFFQQTFRWRIEFNSVVESVEESEDDDDVNFDNMVQTSNNLESLQNLKNPSDEYIVNTDKKDDQYTEEQYVDNYDENVDQEQTEYPEELQEYLDYQENEDLISGREIQMDNSDEYENYYEQSEEEYRNEEYEHGENDDDEYENDENEYHRESDEEPHDSEEHQYYENDEQSYYEENPQDNENEQMYEEENQEEYYEQDQQSEEEEEQYREEEEQVREEEQHSREEEQPSRDDEHHLREEDRHSREDEHELREEDRQSREDEQQLEEPRNDVEKNEESYNEEMEDTKLNPSMIEDLAEETNIKNDNNLSNDTIQEITSIISEKRLEAKKYTINATRAKRALDTLSLKADEVNREIELYENKLRACQS